MTNDPLNDDEGYLTEDEPVKTAPEPPTSDDSQEFAPLPFTPESMGETVRRSGLAWSASIALFGSVVFMLVIGWFADLVLGSSPWGLVAGIVLGSIIGFIQFFRINAQIFKQSQHKSHIHTLKGDDDRL